MDESFPVIAEIIASNPCFDQKPNFTNKNSDSLLIIVLAGNIERLSKFFDDFRDIRIRKHCIVELSRVFELTEEETQTLISSYQSFMHQVNMPSKNILYAMSKCFFFKYDLNPYQEDYFRNMKTPNPILLKALNDLMTRYFWDLEEYDKSFKIV